MREITRDMIKIFNIKKLGYDFMGYTFKRPEDLSFHHLVVPHKDCRDQGLGDGFLFWNGAILNQKTSHDYLHTIERIEREYFLRITKYMIEMNTNQVIDIDNLKRIRELLLEFELRHLEDTNHNGQKLIKTKFLTNRIDFT